MLEPRKNGLSQWPRPENPWDTYQLTCAPGPKTILLSGMREEHVTTLATGVNVHLGEHFSAGLHDHFFFWHHKDALQGKNGLGQWPRPENPWDTHQLTCAPDPKTLLLDGNREELVTTLATGISVHLGEHFSAGLHDHSYQCTQELQWLYIRLCTIGIYLFNMGATLYCAKLFLANKTL